ncbi:hypothetical protein [Streptomyces huiliensis]|uniref:hypothetical protein n=1 Tax=Streptomyces huiliensis TaxID=2876027 RepID=UPI001CBFE493|nr:hypothetical protein [Streptomyces huiliensis]MBZ4318567.1 hypothetical protein [Streptomyces huiliensis]
MTTSEEPTAAVADEGIRQIPPTVRDAQPSAVTEARDHLLRAIGAEARHVADTSPGQASAALAELARAYALVTSGVTGAAAGSEFDVHAGYRPQSKQLVQTGEAHVADENGNLVLD